MRVACLLMQTRWTPSGAVDRLARLAVRHREPLCLRQRLDRRGSFGRASALQAVGLYVDYSHAELSHFRRKGEVKAELIRTLDAGDRPYDFYFPIDCDEFVVAVEDSRLVAGKAALHRALKPFLNEPRVLEVAAHFDNSPQHPDRYLRAPNAEKAFFTRSSCVALDLGQHRGWTK